ncbi:hypothetical protein HBI24_115310 [Parastagonospora nodorum]|nr:hypothetical protein HBI79_076980 [Parastagonospora nodorum]KAH5308477.1 hypothetical protein HBI12_158140 [Parastagonospora nodorum]KAH5432380.1 hypothetical protein HBI47_099690 [Parastagonospora nodorum]KAH5582598.1 hypothetical protein HBI24_115310 [Parastagonospora nodorum]KAH5678327.1 hypothetical protein HBI23_053280 [Parastagonospora nodorum]
MSEYQPSALLAMPTELRLDVYRYLFEDCLADGEVSDVAGLFLCCREIQQELEAELMARVRPLLTAKYEWESTSFRNGIISFKLHRGLNVKAEKVALSVDLPLGKHGLRSITSDYEEAKDALRVALRALKPVLTLPWSVFTLSLGRHAQLEELDIRDVDGLFDRFFRGLHPGSSTFRTLKHIDRLVLSYGHSRSPAYASTSILRTLSDTSYRLGFCLKGRFSRSYTNAWVSRLSTGKDKVWRLTVDFEHGMGAVDGVLFEVGHPGGIRIRTP